MESSDLLHRAILLARRGDKPAVRQLLEEVVRADPYHSPSGFGWQIRRKCYPRGPG